MKKIAMIIEKFDVSINEIDVLNLNQFEKLNLKINTAQACLNELRQEVKHTGFNSAEKEINFFKNQKPYVKGRLKFYAALNAYLLERPVGSKSEIRKYINHQLSEIANQNCNFNSFRNYIKMDKSNMDNSFFRRGISQFELFIENTTLENPNLFEDPDFYTSKDNIVAEIITNDLLSKFFTNELESYKKKSSNQKVQEIQNNKIPWTGTTTQLIEFLFSSNADGSIGNGKLSLKEIGQICIENFDVNPGNIYKTVEQIKARKSNPTKFLDKLRIALLNEINSQFNEI